MFLHNLPTMLSLSSRISPKGTTHEHSVDQNEGDNVRVAPLFSIEISRLQVAFVAGAQEAPRSTWAARILCGPCIASPE